MKDLIYTASVKKVITPKAPVTLGCNGYIHENFVKCDNDLEANALLLVQNGQNFLFLSIDTLYVTDELRDEILAEVDSSYGLTKEIFFWGASHTHYAPFLDESKPGLGHVDVEYKRFFVHQVVELIQELFSQNLMEAELVYKEFEIDNVSINRRKKVWGFTNKILLKKSISIFPNRDNYCDKTCYVLQIYSKLNQDLLSVFYVFACHPTMYHTPRHVTAHFPGLIRDELRKIVGKSIPVLYFQGFSGDVRALNIEKPIGFREKILAVLNGEPGFSNFSQYTYKIWEKSFTTQFLKGVSYAPKKILDGSLAFSYEIVPLAQIMEGDVGNKQIIFHKFLIGEDWMLYGVSAEVVASYLSLIRMKFSGKTVVPVGCIHSVYGYLPRFKMLDEGGYESKGFLKLFSLNNGSFKKNLESLFF
jgi:hypothetical protein